MERIFTAFISLGIPCNGPEAGDYGLFTVDLEEDEIKTLDGIVQERPNGYMRNIVKEKYPHLHGKIVSAAQGLVRDVIINNTELFEPLSESVLTMLDSKSYHEKAEYLSNHIDGIEPDIEQLENAEVCYYLCDDEIPHDFATRYRE